MPKAEEEDGRGQPVHGLRRARPGGEGAGGRQAERRDPRRGSLRPDDGRGPPNDIACWFNDTDYNGERFFVRHAYFTGADQPYEKLQRALRAEIDEAAWSALYSTISRPFDPPKTGKIAVKVINHYGDEVLKVYEVR